MPRRRCVVLSSSSLDVKRSLLAGNGDSPILTGLIMLSGRQKTAFFLMVSMLSMALARLALKKLHKGAISVPSSSFMSKEQRWSFELMNSLFSTSSLTPHDEATSGEVAVSSPDQSGKKSKLFSEKQRNRQLWRNNNHNFVPSLWGLGNALMQATENINRVLENMGPSQLLGRFKEKKECYKLKYEMPGLAKDEVKICKSQAQIYGKGNQHM